MTDQVSHPYKTAGKITHTHTHKLHGAQSFITS